MEKNNDDFKVIDRRGSSANNETNEPSGDKVEPSEQKGEGFVMKEQAAPAGPQQVDFSTFVFSLATGAFINLGLAPDPETKKVKKNIEMARQNIEILSLLKDKTKGNLTGDEQGLLDNLLTEVRLRFVEASKKS